MGSEQKRNQISGLAMVDQLGRTNANSLPQVQIEVEFSPSCLEFWSVGTGRHFEDGAATIVPGDRVDVRPRHRAGQGLRISESDIQVRGDVDELAVRHFASPPADSIVRRSLVWPAARRMDDDPTVIRSHARDEETEQARTSSASFPAS
ncbi:MAG: hypothetical protein QM650_16950 [Microlunatus sp.]